MTGKDCTSLLDATDNPSAWKVWLLLHEAKRWVVFFYESCRNSTKNFNSKRKKCGPTIVSSYRVEAIFFFIYRIKSVTCFYSCISEKISLQWQNNSYFIWRRFCLFPVRDLETGKKILSGHELSHREKLFSASTCEKFAAGRVDTNWSRIRSRLAIANPCPWHPIAWPPKINSFFIERTLTFGGAERDTQPVFCTNVSFSDANLFLRTWNYSLLEASWIVFCKKIGFFIDRSV